jgi:hypothetical protein
MEELNLKLISCLLNLSLLDPKLPEITSLVLLIYFNYLEVVEGFEPT